MLNSLQINQKIPYSPFLRAIDETLKIPGKCWPFPYLNLREHCSSVLPAHAYKMVVTTVCVQQTTASVIRESLSISVRR